MSMLRRRTEPPADRAVRLTIAGRATVAAPGDSVAAAALAAGVAPTRTTPVTGAPRTPYCLMGVCFDCLMVIDGEPNRQACMIEVREGMVVEPQQGAREYGA